MSASDLLERGRLRLAPYDGDPRKYPRWSKKARMIIANMSQSQDWGNCLDLTREKHEIQARKQSVSLSFSSSTSSCSSTSSGPAFYGKKSASLQVDQDQEHQEEESEEASPPPQKIKVQLDTEKESKIVRAVSEARRQVALLLCACLTGEAVDLISFEDARDPYVIWKTLREAARGITIGARSSRYQKLFSTKFQDSDTAQHIVTRMKTLLEDLDLDDDAKVGALQMALPSRLSHFSDLIDSMKAPTYDEVTRILLSKDSTWSNRVVKKRSPVAEVVFGAFDGGGGGGPVAADPASGARKAKAVLEEGDPRRKRRNPPVLTATLLHI